MTVVPEGLYDKEHGDPFRSEAQEDPARSEPRGPDKTQRGQSPEGQTRPSVLKGPEWSEPKEARQTRRGQMPKGSGEHRRCGVAFLIHRGVNLGGRDAPGSKPQNRASPAGRFPWLVWTLGCFLCPLNRAGAEWSWALGRIRQVKRPRSWRTGETFKTGTPSTNSFQPTQPDRRSKVRPRASRSSSQGRGTSGN